QDGYEVRPIAHSDGTIYVAYKAWQAQNGNTITADIVVARDDNWGMGDFNDLQGSDAKAGWRVATVAIRDPQYIGGQRLNNDLSIAVDPTNSDTVYIAW